ncbi:hypothetical protein AVT69_gp070 [Pseudomonas phage PhiPA3]|uniref:Uncharacterized protein 071 n=1 Tax=Pseudomonas phage PhiPA3 TaxID=998086 RepID=F8SJV0_BPPA3|nr:hypothetical protein AVT69_gp070 [Pseudomonas phage PhiPA3]AEH03495.1 hypothetical protein [Pseudomonas phage PhiPA3]
MELFHNPLAVVYFLISPIGIFLFVLILLWGLIAQRWIVYGYPKHSFLRRLNWLVWLGITLLYLMVFLSSLGCVFAFPTSSVCNVWG